MPRKRTLRDGSPELTARLRAFAKENLDDPGGWFGFRQYLEHAIVHRHSGFGRDLPAGADEMERQARLQEARDGHAQDMKRVRRLQAATKAALADAESGKSWQEVSDRHLGVFRRLERECRVDENLVRRSWAISTAPVGSPDREELEKSVNRVRLLRDGREETAFPVALELIGPASERYGEVCRDALEWLERSGACLECGKRLPRGSNSNRLFCERPCMLAYHRRPEVEERRASEQ
jgi:hypothetical protein